MLAEYRRALFGRPCRIGIVAGHNLRTKGRVLEVGRAKLGRLSSCRSMRMSIGIATVTVVRGVTLVMCECS